MDAFYNCYMIPRTQLDKTARLLKQFPAVALLGARQTGKTTVAKQIMAAREGQKGGDGSVLYLDLEKDSHRQRLENDAEAYLSMHTDKLVIIDEVQRKPELFALLRALIDEKRVPGRFLLLGSSSPHLVKGVSESLAGRIAYVEIGGISIAEAQKAGINIETLWLRGGFPIPLLADSEQQVGEWHEHFIQSYIKRDLASLFGAAFSDKVLGNFWTMLAGSNGGLFNKEIYARSLGVTGPTVARYQHYMDAAFLTNELQPWSASTRKRLAKASKIYIRDSGIMHALNKINSMDALRGSLHAGSSWEGFVVEQLRLAKGNSDLYFYRTHNGAEVDVVLAKGNKPVACIEIKLSTSPQLTKGFYEVVNDLKTKNNYVIIPSGDAFPMDNGVWCYNLAEFVHDILPDIAK